MIRALLILLLSIRAALASTNCIVIGEGDSLTFGTGGTAGSNYVAQMNLVNLYGTYATNIGHAGDLIATNTTAFDALRNLTNATAYSKRTVVWLMMINDLAGNDSVVNVTTNYNAWADNVKAAFPDTKIMAITQFDANVSGTITGRVMEVNAWLRTNTTRFDYVADAALDSRLDDHTDTTYFDADGVHLNDAGYAVLAGIVSSNLVYQRRVVIDYYVRKDGSDSNRGFTNTAAGAKLTIQNALDRATLYDTITIDAGVYAEIPNIQAASGLVGHHLTITNAGNVVMHGISMRGKSNIIWSVDGFNLTGTNIAGDAAINLDFTGANYNTFRGIGITGSNSVIAGFEQSISVGAKGILSGTLTTNNYFDDIRMTNCNDTFVTLLGRGHVLTNSLMTGSNGWDIMRPFGPDMRLVQNTVTNVQNPGDYNANHSDIWQVFGDDPATISTNVLIAGNKVMFAPNYQFGNITDDQENGNIGRWTFQNNLLVDIASTMNLFAPDFHFYNNTFIRCGPVSNWPLIWGVSTAGYSHGIHVVNNIFDRCGTTNSSNNGWYSGDTITNYWLGYNSVRGDVAKTGYTPEAGSIKDTDLLLNTSTYKPTTGSAAFNAGTNLLSLFTVDLELVTRDSTPTLGAFEGEGASSSTYNAFTIGQGVTLRNGVTIRQ